MPARCPSTAAIVQRLTTAGCVAPEEEARELVSAAPDPDTLDRWIRRREEGEPLAWITGTIQFCGHTITVARGVYVPRQQSEGLARRGALRLVASCGGRAVDLCTGAGAIAVHLMTEAPAATVFGVDIDWPAAACARRNGVDVVVADLDSCLPSARFDLVTAVAPYVPTGALNLLPADVQRHEPRHALDGGVDGLDVTRRIVAAAGRLLRPGGWLVIELGGDQDRALGPTLAAAGFTRVATWLGQDGDLRGLEAEASGSRA